MICVTRYIICMIIYLPGLRIVRHISLSEKNKGVSGSIDIGSATICNYGHMWSMQKYSIQVRLIMINYYCLLQCITLLITFLVQIKVFRTLIFSKVY